TNSDLYDGSFLTLVGFHRSTRWDTAHQLRWESLWHYIFSRRRRGTLAGQSCLTSSQRQPRPDGHLSGFPHSCPPHATCRSHGETCPLLSEVRAAAYMLCGPRSPGQIQSPNTREGTSAKQAEHLASRPPFAVSLLLNVRLPLFSLETYEFAT